jgi:hypothetical protein
MAKIGQHRKREALKRLVDTHEVLRAYDGNESERRSLLIEESISHAVLSRRFARRTYTLTTSAHSGKTSGAQYRRPGLRSSKSAST